MVKGNSREGDKEVMAQYADILSVEVPAEAKAGEIVDVRVEIKNLYSAVISIKTSAIVFVNTDAYASVTFPTEYVNLDPGHKYQFWGYFTMPSNDVWVHAVSYWYGADGHWHIDDTMDKDIKLAELVPGFSEFAISSFSKV